VDIIKGYDIYNSSVKNNIVINNEHKLTLISTTKHGNAYYIGLQITNHIIVK